MTPNTLSIDSCGYLIRFLWGDWSCKRYTWDALIIAINNIE